MSRIDYELSRELVNEALRSDEEFVVAHQRDPMFRATVSNLRSEVHALLETFADGDTVAAPHAFVLAYAVRRLNDVHRAARDLERLEHHLRMSAARSLLREF